MQFFFSVAVNDEIILSTLKPQCIVSEGGEDIKLKEVKLMSAG
jgi:hypothetical protein